MQLGSYCPHNYYVTDNLEKLQSFLSRKHYVEM